MKMFWVSCLLLLLWLILAQGCMTFRKEDSKQNRNLVKTESYSIPRRSRLTVIISIMRSREVIVCLLYSSYMAPPGSWDAFADYLKDKTLLGRFRMVAIDRPVSVTVTMANRNISQHSQN